MSAAGKTPGPRDLAAEVMRSAEQGFRVVDWPGRVPAALRERLPSGKVALVELSRQAKLDAQIDATKYLFHERKLDPVQVAMLQPEGFFEFEREIQVLARALHDADAPEHELLKPEELRTAISTDAQEALMRLYNAYERDCSPLTKSEDPAEVKELLRRLKANGALSTLVTCSDFGTGKSIALALAELWLEQPSASSSGT